MGAVVLVAALKKLGELLGDIANWLMAFGPLGLFGIALLDSALVPLPSGPDVIMIGLSASRPAMMPVYALAATVGSTIGCTLLYLAARKAGATALKRVSEARRKRIEGLLGRYDMLAVMVPAILPPPFPFKAFVLSAGVFRLKIVRFVTAIFIGRALRFLLEGWLAIEFGEDAVRIIKKHGLPVLIGALAVLLAALLVRVYLSRSDRSSAPAGDAASSPPPTVNLSD